MQDEKQSSSYFRALDAISAFYEELGMVSCRHWSLEVLSVSLLLS
jgi:hypothetical protein